MSNDKKTESGEERQQTRQYFTGFERTEMSPGFEVKLQAEGLTFDESDAVLLRAIDDTGSLNGAAETLGRSYSRAHKRLASLEEAFGVLVTSKRGGAGGGGSTLTNQARHLLVRFERLRTEFSGISAVAETVLKGTVVEYSGELATIETDVGCLRALTPPDVSAVYVTIRADAVTLHDPDEIPATTEMSARNRIAGTVVGLTDGESIQRVTLDIGRGHQLTVLITSESSKQLDVRRGRTVIASFKTTATRATPTQWS